MNERIQDLLHYMADCSDHDHADLSSEMERLKALADLSGEWVAEMQDVAAEPEAACTEPLSTVSPYRRGGMEQQDAKIPLNI